MSRTPRDRTDVKRLTLDMNQVIHDRMKKLRDDTHADSLTEVVRRALAIYEFLWERKTDGGTIYIHHTGGEKERLELL